jgi:hypothetical protein
MLTYSEPGLLAMVKRHVDILAPAMTRNPGPNFDELLYQPSDRPLDLLA